MTTIRIPISQDSILIGSLISVFIFLLSIGPIIMLIINFWVGLLMTIIFTLISTWAIREFVYINLNIKVLFKGDKEYEK